MSGTVRPMHVDRPIEAVDRIMQRHHEIMTTWGQLLTSVTYSPFNKANPHDIPLTTSKLVICSAFATFWGSQ